MFDATATRLKERALLLLESQPVPLSSTTLARELLGVRGGSEDVAHELLAPLLLEDRRFVARSDGRWALGEPSEAYRAPRPSSWPWSVWWVAPDLAAAGLVRLEGGSATAERAERAYSARSRAARATGVTGGAPILSETALRRLAACGRDSFWVIDGQARDVRATKRRLAAEGLRPPDATPLALADLRAVAAATHMGRDDSLPQATRRVVSEAPDPAREARMSADTLLGLLDRPPFSGARDFSEILGLCRRPVAAPDLSARAFSRADLEAIPECPGTYRFLGFDGRVLYVGKSKNLQVRVGSYFASRRRPDPRTASWLPLVHRFEVEPSGSELEALLREAESIARERPRHNVQRIVHDRGSRRSADLVLILPATRGGARVFLVRDGIIAARTIVRPPGRGRSKLRALLERVYFVPGSPHAVRPERDLRGRALLGSWLARQSGAIPAFDPTDLPTASEAAARALMYAVSLSRGEQDVVYR